MDGVFERDARICSELTSAAFSKGVHLSSLKGRYLWTVNRVLEVGIKEAWSEYRISAVITRVIRGLSRQGDSENKWDEYLDTTSF